MTQVTGKEVACCFELVNRIWKEIDLMADRLGDLLKKGIDEAGLHVIDGSRSKDLTLVEDAVFDDDHSEVLIGRIHNIPVKTRPRLQRPDRFFGFQISLADTLIAIPGNEEPVIYLYMSTGAEMSFGEWFMSFPMDPDEDETDFEVQDGIVLKWVDGSIVYAVRLMDLQSEADLRALCIEPLMALYNDQSVEQAFGNPPDNRIVRFPEKTALIAGEF